MNRLLSLLILGSLPLSMLPPLQAQQQAQPADDVIRISTNLIQIDAVVNDKDGNPIKDLTAGDFEVLQDGKPQKIVSVSYVNTEPLVRPDSLKKTEKQTPIAPPSRTRPENAGRVLTFVVDDGNCTASRIGMTAAREALEKFIKEQMRPDDLVAIYQTKSGSSALQQFTSDKTQLLRVAQKIHWTPPRGACSNIANGDFFDAAQVIDPNPVTGGSAMTKLKSEADRASQAKIDNRARNNQVVGLLGVLRYITRGLQRVSGRKTVFLLSDGIPMFELDPEQKGPPNSPMTTMKPNDSGGVMRDLVDSANRALVTFNTIDVRGVLVGAGGITAEDEFEGIKGNMNVTSGTLANRSATISNSQSGMTYLANETGGRFYHDANDLSVPVRRALNLEKGYYLIGYQPDGDTFKNKKFNKIEIKVKRPELSVRSRSGFFGITDESLRAKKRTGDSELYEALAAPLPNSGLAIQLTAFFGDTASEGSFVRALLHLDGEQISFVDEPNEMKKAVFDVVAVTLNEKNEVVNDFNRTHTIRIPAANLADVRQNGLIYTADIPVKKPGAYNFRVAIRDVASKQLGSAGQQIEVPDLKKNDLHLSGLTIGEVEFKDGTPRMSLVDKVENGFAVVAGVSNPAIRRFRPGATLGYSYKIYNAQLNQATKSPKLTIQVRIFRDGQVVEEGKPQAAQLKPQTDMTRITDYGFLRLPAGAPKGDYALQIIIKDLQLNETSSQWIDFEVVR